MLLLEFSMTPLDKGESVSAYVARALDIVDRSGLPYQFTPMGTIIEGDWDAAMKVLGDCFKALESDCKRISIAVKIDYRAGRTGALTKKLDSVESRLGRKLKR